VDSALVAGVSQSRLYNELLHLSGAVFKEAIAFDRLEVQLPARYRAPLKRPPAGERGVLPTRGLLFRALRASSFDEGQMRLLTVDR
jgi:hypothetical protein